MVKIIETNLSTTYGGEIIDHQSRVIEVSSWNEYVDLFKTYHGEPMGDYRAILGSMHGYVLPKGCILNGLGYDGHHLTCTVRHFDGTSSKKLAYKTYEDTPNLAEDGTRCRNNGMCYDCAYCL